MRHPNTNCIICNTEIYRRPSQLEKNNGRAYCSVICYGISQRQEIPCIICGKMIRKGENKKTCSRACANKHREGIKYKINRPRDKVKNYFALKIRLAKIRGKICQKCGYNKYEILQVHHKDKNRDNNDLENLELICPNCHFEAHYLERKFRRLLKNK